jgi:hypothetical protein
MTGIIEIFTAFSTGAELMTDGQSTSSVSGILNNYRSIRTCRRIIFMQARDFKS